MAGRERLAQKIWWSPVGPTSQRTSAYKGYEKRHPDSNVVYRYIMGQESIVKKHKWLLQTRKKDLPTVDTGGFSRIDSRKGESTRYRGVSA